jgi:oligoribonuclease NrnB/cAMP/cGMP phosphodiesterase (DHH superfamily)
MLALNLRLGEKLIWIDHHQRTVNEVNSYLIEKGIPMEGMVTEDGELKAACELAWEYFFPEETMPEIVRLLGRYDCFGHMGTSEEKTVVEFQYGARECIFDYETAYAHLVDEGTEFKNPEVNTLNIILEKGKSIYGYLCTEAKQVYQNGFEIHIGTKYIGGMDPVSPTETVQTFKYPYKFICINKERFNAINFGIDYHAQGYDGQACFFRTKEGKWSFSFYSQTVDCSAIAKQFGGGGHKGAAGCVVDDETMLKIINS